MNKHDKATLISYDKQGRSQNLKAVPQNFMKFF